MARAGATRAGGVEGGGGEGGGSEGGVAVLSGLSAEMVAKEEAVAEVEAVARAVEPRVMMEA